MPDGYSLELQAAIVAALKADAGVSALVGARVYGDREPQGAVYPFTKFSAMVERPLRTDGKAAATMTFGIECHAEGRGAQTVCHQIAEAVKVALDEQSLPVTGFENVYTHCIEKLGPELELDDRTFSLVAFRTLLDG